MLNILLPMAGGNQYFDTTDFPFPKPLIEIGGTPMIELVIQNLSKIQQEKRFIFLVKEDDCRKFHLDNTLRLLGSASSIVIPVGGETQGALCSALLAIDYIAGDAPLLIANSDQLIRGDITQVYQKLAQSHNEAACVTFDSVHPRWSYVRQNHSGQIIEAAEKNPISNTAIAGLYYFAKGDHFIASAKSAIRKGASVDGKFFTSAAINEMILAGKNVRAVHIPKECYVSFYTPQKIAEYESHHAREHS
jgi:NDP-sugar pyrophosphorylase family protein